MLNRAHYQGREQAYVKHFVLNNYLQRLAFKLGGARPGVTINYVDGFSGPWQQSAPDLSDTSPWVALRQLRAVREDLGGGIAVRCLFIEREEEAFQQLEGVQRAFPDIAIERLHGEFEQHIGEVVRFARAGDDPFAFVFIDPTGWTGYGLQAITPVLQLRPGEVLINFMTKDIKRFIDDTSSTALPTFQDLYGTGDFRERWRGLTGLDREDAIVTTYCDRVREAGGFPFCASTIVLDPIANRTHYHLVYATRSLRGLATFREVERSAMTEQEDLHGATRQEHRVAQSAQGELFAPHVIEASYVGELRTRYRDQAQAHVREQLTRMHQVPYEEVVKTALHFPMTAESDLKEWLKAWKSRGEVEFVGLDARERVPKINRHHAIRWSKDLAQ